MKKYEIMYILNASLDEETRKGVMNKLQTLIESLHGKVLETKEWGSRDLASPINEQTKGYYVILKANLDNAGLNEFNRVVKLDNNVLRHLVTVAVD